MLTKIVPVNFVLFGVVCFALFFIIIDERAMKRQLFFPLFFLKKQKRFAASERSETPYRTHLLKSRSPAGWNLFKLAHKQQA